jgi:hypothetical protein
LVGNAFNFTFKQVVDELIGFSSELMHDFRILVYDEFLELFVLASNLSSDQLGQMVYLIAQVIQRRLHG